MNLLEMKCEPCEGGVEPLKGEKLTPYMSELKNEWQVEKEFKITHSFKFEDYIKTMAFVNQVAELSEAEGHHPVLHVYWGKVDIELWTHTVSGLSENDFILAAKIDELALNN